MNAGLRRWVDIIYGGMTHTHHEQTFEWFSFFFRVIHEFHIANNKQARLTHQPSVRKGKSISQYYNTTVHCSRIFRKLCPSRPLSPP